MLQFIMVKLKKQIKVWTLALLGFFVSLGVNAQTLSGRVTDANGSPLSFVNIVLMAQPDSTFITGTTSDEQGMFTLQQPEHDYWLRLSSIGYETLYLSSQNQNAWGTLVLQPASTQLGDVVVKGNLPTHKLTASGMQTQVQGTVLQQVGTAEDILAHVPGLQKKNSGYEVFGKGTPIIYINGRLVRDLSELDQLKSNQVKSVELITSPGARYDATVRAVIRIRTLQAQGEGWGIDARSTWQQSSNADLLNQLSLNYRKRGLDIFGMASFDTNGDYQHSPIIQDIQADTLWRQQNRADSYTRRRMGKAQLGVNWQINDDNALGIRFDTKRMLHFASTGTVISDIFANSQLFDHMENANDDYLDKSYTHDANVYYNGKLAGWSIDLNADWENSRQNYGSVFTEKSDAFDDRTFDSKNQIQHTLWAAKLVMNHDLWGGEVSLGAEYTYTDRHDDYINPQNIVPTSYAQLKDKGIAPFLEYAHALPHGNVKFGLRYEAMQFDYYHNGQHMDEQSRSFHNWFPSLSLAMQWGKVQTVMNVVMKTVRPTYRDLSGNVSYVNRFTLQTGNPYLKPATVYDFNVQATWKIWSLTTGYTNTRNVVLDWAEQMVGQASVTVLGKENFKSSKVFNAQLVAAPHLGLWHPQFMAGVSQPWLSVPTATGIMRFNKPIFVFHTGNTFQFSPTFIGECSLQCVTPGNEANMKIDKAIITAGASVTKTFLNNRFSLKVGVSDIFYHDESVVLYNRQMQIHQGNHTDSRHLDVTLRYVLNTSRSHYKGTGAGNAEKVRL